MSNERIIAFLAQGTPAVEVMNITGVSSAYMKGLLADPEFLKEVEEKAKGYLKEADEEEIVSNKYLSVEHKILKAIEGQVGTAELGDLTRALQVVANRQDKVASRKAGFNPNGQNTTTINQVILNLPQHAIPEYVLNSNKEVVQINDRTMNPMNSKTVQGLFEGMRENMVTVEQIS
jgi:hypothetical protein